LHLRKKREGGTYSKCDKYDILLKSSEGHAECKGDHKGEKNTYILLILHTREKQPDKMQCTGNPKNSYGLIICESAILLLF